MEYKDYYKILGVPKKADEKEIKRAYRKLAREYHPDINPDNKTAEEKFKEINEAYEVLGSADNRSRYDQLGSNYHRYQQMGGNPSDYDFSQWFSQGAPGGARYQNIDLGDLFGSGGGGFSEFFNSIFGGAAGQQGFSQQDLFGGRGAVNLDTTQTVDITLEEAYQGTTRTFSQNGERFTAKIPSGAKTGTKVRLRGKGNKNQYGAGDLFLVMNVKPHDTFRRAGNNLQVEVKVDVVTAVLGGKVQVPTMTGPVSLNIPAGTQGGQTFRLRGKGMPLLRDNSQYGDLLAETHIQIPQNLSERDRSLYEQLADREKTHA